MGQIILMWGFPFYLIILEFLFRSVSGLDVSSFIGPAIATAGLSFLLPLTKPKLHTELFSANLLEEVLGSGGEIVNIKDQRLIPFIWISILCGFLIWFWSSFVSSTSSNAMFYFIPLHIAIGLINYIIAAAFTLAKERV